MEFLTKLLQSIGFDDVGSFLGSDMMKNVVAGGIGGLGMKNANDALDFQKGAYTDARADQNILMEDYQEDREKNQNLKFS